MRSCRQPHFWEAHTVLSGIRHCVLSPGATAALENPGPKQLQGWGPRLRLTEQTRMHGVTLGLRDEPSLWLSCVSPLTKDAGLERQEPGFCLKLIRTGQALAPREPSVPEQAPVVGTVAPRWPSRWPSQAGGGAVWGRNAGPRPKRGRDASALLVVGLEMWGLRPLRGAGALPRHCWWKACAGAVASGGQQSPVPGQEAQTPRVPSMGPRSPRCAGRRRGLLVTLETS